jgi:hypothetical protein
MNFLNYFTEAKFREIPLSVSKKARKIAQLYASDYRNFNKQELAIYAKRITDPSWIDYLEDPGYTHLALMTTVSILDLETNKNKKIEVYVIYGNPKNSKNLDDMAEYNDANRTIFLYDYRCKSLSLVDLEATILHEFTHGFQQYKNLPAQEDDEPAEEQHEFDYYLSPEEVDAYLTELAYRIRLEHSNLITLLKKPSVSSKASNLKKLNKFLLELKVFIQSPLDTYFVYRELPLPKTIKQSEEFLETIANFTPYWNKFKTKMTKLYNELINSSKDFYEQQ